MNQETIVKEIPTVNYHLWKSCNMSCGFCFATFDDLPPQFVTYLKKDDAILLVDSLCQHGFSKINFAGGEPTLCRWLPDLIRRTKLRGVTTSIVTNGSRITEKWLDDLDGTLDILALSIDSANLETSRLIGRKTQDGPMSADDYRRIADAVKQRGIRLKVNTVVSRANCAEDITAFIKAIHPERWKVFQALPVRGQNDQRIADFIVSDDEFSRYLERNKPTVLQAGIKVVPESNELMTGSYIMVDPMGRFFDNTKGEHTYSSPILDVGVAGALREVESYPERFDRRGGLYSI